MTDRTDAIRAELLALKKKGLVSAREAVEWARKNPRSALHAALNWDDKDAAQEWRVEQVRRLIQVHIIAVDGGRQFVSLSIDRARGGGYRDIDQVKGSERLRDILLQDALDELERVRSHYQSLQELSRVWAEAAKVRAAHRIKAAGSAA